MTKSEERTPAQAGAEALRLAGHCPECWKVLVDCLERYLNQFLDREAAPAQP